MEQLEHIFRRTQSAWYNVGKLEKVCKKVEIAADAVSVLLQPTGERSTVERLIRLVNEYRTFEPLFSEFYSAVRVAGTMITAIPIDRDSEMLRDLVTKTKDHAHKQCGNLVSKIFRGGHRLNPDRPFPVQRKLSDLYLELMHRDVDFFLAQINDAAWITANCSEEWSRQNVLTYLDLLIGDVQAFLLTPRRYTKENKRKVLKSTTLPNLSNAREKVKKVETKETLPTESSNPPTQKNTEGGESAEKTHEAVNAENMQGGQSAEKTREAEKMKEGESAEKTPENMEEGESAEEMETADTEKKVNQPITDPTQLSHHLWIQFKKSLFAYRSLWMKFIFLPAKAMNREALPERYSRMVDEQMKLSIAFDELSTSYPEGEKSPKLDLFKTDMELLFRKTHVSYQAMLKSFGDKDFADRFDVHGKELAEHAENIGKMMNDLQNTESIQFEELEQHRLFVDSEICYLNNSVHGLLEDFVAACQKGYASQLLYKKQHSKGLQLLKTCEWLKHFLSLERTVYCNNPLWSKILCDGRTLTLEMSGRSTNLSGLFAPVSRVWSFVVKNGVIKESENTPEVVNKVFRPLILVVGRQLQEDMEKVPAEMLLNLLMRKESENIETVMDTMFRPHWVIRKVLMEYRKKVPAETLLNLLMRKLEKSASKEAAEYAFDQLGLMGTFTRDRLMSVFPADSPLLKHLLGHLPKPFEEIPEQGENALQMVQRALENVPKISEKVQKVAENVRKVPDSCSKNAADGTISTTATVCNARSALVIKKNAVTIEMPDVKPNIKDIETTVVKKEVETASENDNIAAGTVTTDSNWYSNFTPGFVPTNSEVEASPINNKVVTNIDSNSAFPVVVTDWCNNIRTISENVLGTTAKKVANTSCSGNIGSSNDNIESGNGNIASINGNIASNNDNIASGNGNTSQPVTASEISDTVTVRDVIEALYKRPITM